MERDALVAAAGREEAEEKRLGERIAVLEQQFREAGAERRELRRVSKDLLVVTCL